MIVRLVLLGQAIILWLTHRLRSLLPIRGVIRPISAGVHTHRALRIPEILFNIFGHCSPQDASPLERQRHNADLAALARTCTAFKDPALDVLWEDLFDLTPLVRCLPGVCRVAGSGPVPSIFRFAQSVACYSFSRPLKEVEWKTLLGYTRRVRSIRGFDSRFGHLHEDTFREVLSLVPSSGSLFPHLRSLYWFYFAEFAPLQVAVSSLTNLYLNFVSSRMDHHPVSEIFDTLNLGDRCPRIESIDIDIQFPIPGTVDSAISRQICHWKRLRKVSCENISLNLDAILHLSSIVGLRHLSFTAHIGTIQGISRLGSVLVFPGLENLAIKTRSLDTITSLLSCVCLPVIEALHVSTSNRISRRAMQAYWTAAREACPSVVSICLTCMLDRGNEDLVPRDENVHQELTLEDLRPWTALFKLRKVYISLDWHVKLTDADFLALMSPQMEEVVINSEFGWRTGMNGGGITLSGLVQLLRQCPSLRYLGLAIDTRTFTEIPEGLDVSFPSRTGLRFDFVDSYIEEEFVPGIISAFAALGLNPSMISCRPICGTNMGLLALGLWGSVRYGLHKVFRE